MLSENRRVLFCSHSQLVTLPGEEEDGDHDRGVSEGRCGWRGMLELVM